MKNLKTVIGYEGHFECISVSNSKSTNQLSLVEERKLEIGDGAGVGTVDWHIGLSSLRS